MPFSTLARAGAFGLVFASSIAAAQQPLPVRGAIQSLDGSMLVVKPADGPDVSIKLADNVQVFGVRPATIADVKVGDFIGVGAMPQPDGSQKAILVTIFAESLRGLGEGFRPWDRPGTTMTNATVDSIVAGIDGQEVLVKYKDGEKKIVIGRDAKLRAYVAGERADLVPGARIAVMRPDKLADGSLQAGRINVGRDGLVP